MTFFCDFYRWDKMCLSACLFWTLLQFVPVCVLFYVMLHCLVWNALYIE